MDETSKASHSLKFQFFTERKQKQRVREKCNFGLGCLYGLGVAEPTASETNERFGFRSVTVNEERRVQADSELESKYRLQSSEEGGESIVTVICILYCHHYTW